MSGRRLDRVPVWLVCTLISIAFAVAAVVAAWLIWLGISTFVLYGYQSIVWILS